jgi:hypothetical protein
MDALRLIVLYDGVCGIWRHHEELHAMDTLSHVWNAVTSRARKYVYGEIGPFIVLNRIAIIGKTFVFSSGYATIHSSSAVLRGGNSCE